MLRIVITWCLFFVNVSSVFGEELSLKDYLTELRNSHPYLLQESLTPEIYDSITQGTRASKDWTLKGSSIYSHQEEPSRAFGMPSRNDSIDSTASLSKEIWETGGQLSLSYSQRYLDQPTQYIDFPGVGSSDNFAIPSASDFNQGIQIHYSHPILQNFLGVLSRLGFQLADLESDIQMLISKENQEEFIKQQSINFIGWADLADQRVIVRVREELANKQYEQAKRKFEKNLIEKVDVILSEDNLLQVQQDLKLLDSLYNKSKVELLHVAGLDIDIDYQPKTDLSQLNQIHETINPNFPIQSTRLIKILQTKLDQLAIKETAQSNTIKPKLNLIVDGGVVKEDNSYSKSLTMDKPRVGAGLQFEYPLENTAAKTELQRIKLTIRQLKYSLDSEQRTLSSYLKSICAQLEQLFLLVEMTKRQILVSHQRTLEEQRLYEQGRRELSFVLSAQNSEQIVKISLVQHLSSIQKLYIEYLALTDQLSAYQSEL